MKKTEVFNDYIAVFKILNFCTINNCDEFAREISNLKENCQKVISNMEKFIENNALNNFSFCVLKQNLMDSLPVSCLDDKLYSVQHNLEKNVKKFNNIAKHWQKI